MLAFSTQFCFYRGFRISQDMLNGIKRRFSTICSRHIAKAGRNLFISYNKFGTWWRSWSKHCASSRNVKGSIHDGIIGIFHLHIPSSRTVARGSTQSITEMSSRNISLGSKGGWCVGLTTLPPSCLEIWEPQPPETVAA